MVEKGGKMQKIYVTSYALTSGISEVYAEINRSNKRAAVRSRDGSCTRYFYGKDWHVTRELAVARAEEMRIKKLQALDKQMKKISALVF